MQFSVSDRKQVTFVKKYLRVNYCMSRFCSNRIYCFSGVERRKRAYTNYLYAARKANNLKKGVNNIK